MTFLKTVVADENGLKKLVMARDVIEIFKKLDIVNTSTLFRSQICW